VDATAAFGDHWFLLADDATARKTESVSVLAVYLTAAQFCPPA